MFKRTQNLLKQYQKPIPFHMPILPDNDGYYDKECPNPECLSKFKVNAEDWKNLFSDDEVHCPFCGYVSLANTWWTTEQVEEAKRQAIEQVRAQIGQALQADVRAFNHSQPKNSLVKFSMKFKGNTRFVCLPAQALEEMTQKIQCDNCGARYEVIGSAFYCPCCGYNSAELTFRNTIEKVRGKIKNLEMIRQAIEPISKDEAARTCTSLLESSIPDLVVAFQRLCECVYPQLAPAKPLKKNVFQRLADGSDLWKELVGKGYSDWITEEQYSKLKKCFQQRHLLQHQDGIIDQEYITKSGDTLYTMGQHLIVKTTDVDEYADIVEKLGNEILNLLHTKKMEKE